MSLSPRPELERTTSAISTIARTFSADAAVHDVEKSPYAAESKEDESSRQDSDPNIVDWDGEDDPEKPLNWSSRKKWINVMVLAGLTLLTPFCSSMFAPAVPATMREFRSDSVDLATFSVSVYVLGYTCGPLIIAPLSELYGRRPVYHVCTVFFIIFNIGCAAATSLPMLIIFRFLSGFAGVCPLTVGSGTIADMFKQEQRGKVMSVWTFPVLIGPTFGPVVGAYISQAAGWRWDFWFIVIVGGALLIMALIVQDETYPPTLLARKTRRLQKKTGNPLLRSALRPSKTPMQMFLTAIVRPTKMLFLSPIVFGLSLFIAICYGYLYLFFTTLTVVFQGQYGFSTGSAGLTFLGIGVGQFVGLLGFGMLSDKMLVKAAKGGELKPEYRLPPLVPGGLFMPVGLLIYGWSAYYKVHWMVPIIGTVFIGMSMIVCFMPIGTYLVDAFTVYAASAMAANTVLRSLFGAVLPLAGRRLYNNLGLGWGNTLLAFISLSLMPMIWVFMKYGERIRTSPKFQLKL